MKNLLILGDSFGVDPVALQKALKARFFSNFPSLPFRVFFHFHLQMNWEMIFAQVSRIILDKAPSVIILNPSDFHFSQLSTTLQGKSSEVAQATLHLIRSKSDAKIILIHRPSPFLPAQYSSDPLNSPSSSRLTQENLKEGHFHTLDFAQVWENFYQIHSQYQGDQQPLFQGKDHSLTELGIQLLGKTIEKIFNQKVWEIE